MLEGGPVDLFGYAFGFCGCKMLQGIFDFQCMMDGATARYWKALLAPVLPLILLTLCGLMEFAKHGSGCLTAALYVECFDSSMHFNIPTIVFHLTLVVRGFLCNESYNDK